MAYRVVVPQLGAFVVGEDETIVEAATRQGIAYPFSCHSGTCGTCKSNLIRGEVTMLDYSKFTLRDEERAAGLILACCAIPRTDCEVTPVADSSPIPAQRIQCRVASVDEGTHDIKILRLAPPGERRCPSWPDSSRTLLSPINRPEATQWPVVPASPNWNSMSG